MNKAKHATFSSFHTGFTDKTIGFIGMSISVLAFIRMPPQSRCSDKIRLEAEHNLINTLRTIWPKSVNREDSKIYIKWRK